MRSPSIWKCAEAIIAVSESVRISLLRQGVEASRVRVIPDGVSLEEVSVQVPGRLRAVSGVGAGVPLVGVVGALTPEKGHAWFLESAARVAAAIPDAQFVIFGDGPERDRLTGLVAALGLEQRVAMPGHVDRIGQSLCDLDLFVMPSLTEGMGTAAVEAMLAGCPVVLSGAGGLVDLAGSSIETVQPGDVPGLAAEMERLLTDETERRVLARRARERGGSFTAERTTLATLQLYRELVPGS
jgi:glycosyltransferase involved in cell wall biosynthesis